jgi:hypothetical protein
MKNRKLPTNKKVLEIEIKPPETIKNSLVISNIDLEVLILDINANR